MKGAIKKILDYINSEIVTEANFYASMAVIWGLFAIAGLVFGIFAHYAHLFIFIGSLIISYASCVEYAKIIVKNQKKSEK